MKIEHTFFILLLILYSTCFSVDSLDCEEEEPRDEIEVDNSAARSRELIADSRQASRDWYIELMDAFNIYQCEQNEWDLEKNRVVPADDSSANIRRGTCRCSKDFLELGYDCETDCEIQANCYWGPVRANEYRMVNYDEGDVKESEKMQGEYVNGIARLTIPQVVLAFVVLVGTIIYGIVRVCCCCCFRCCCTKCCKPDEKGYTFCQISAPIFFYVVFGLGVFVCSILAFLGNENITSGIDKAYVSVDNGIDGTVEFIGGAAGPMIGVRDTTVDAVNETIDILSNTGWTSSGMTTLKAMIGTFNSSYAAEEEFIRDAMGDAIENLDESIDPIVENIENTLDTLQNGLVGMRNDIVQTVNAGLQGLLTMNRTLFDMKSTLRDGYEQATTDDIEGYRQAGVLFVFITAILLFILGLIACFASWTSCKYDDWLIYLFHIVWALGAIVCFVAFLISAVATFVSVFFVDSCEMMNILVEDFTPYMPDSATGLNACFNDTPLVEAYNMTDQLAFADQLTEQFAILEESDTEEAFAGAKTPIIETGEFLLNLTATSEMNNFNKEFTNRNEENSNCPFADIYTERHIRTPWTQPSNTGVTSWNSQNYERASDTETGKAYMERIYDYADIEANCERTIEALLEAWETLHDSVQLIENMEADLGYNEELCKNISCPTAEWPYPNTLLEQLESYERNVTNLEESLLNVTTGLVGELIGHVDDFFCNMKCGFVADLYFEMENAFCNSLLGGFAQINVAIFLLAVFQIPIILIAEVLVTRLFGKSKRTLFKEKKKKEAEERKKQEMEMVSSVNSPHGSVNSGYSLPPQI